MKDKIARNWKFEGYLKGKLKNLKTKSRVEIALEAEGSIKKSSRMKLKKVSRIRFNWEGLIAWFQNSKVWISVKVFEPYLG